jgi:two-component system alkaline phosphatase synthesis response regulator PhoP
VSARVLVVEDDALVRNLVVINLVDGGFSVDTAATFAAGQARLAAGGWDLAILDVMLPGGDGFELVRGARASGNKAPILMLTARTGTHDKVRALDGGADDYLAKPFDVDELLARVRALLRRFGAVGPAPLPEVVIGSFRVRLDSGEADSNEGPVVLSDKELRLVALFSRLENQPLSRADILEEVWGMDASPTDRTVDNFILRLRRLFEPDPEHPVHFVTLRGRGYLFRREPTP